MRVVQSIPLFTCYVCRYCKGKLHRLGGCGWERGILRGEFCRGCQVGGRVAWRSVSFPWRLGLFHWLLRPFFCWWECRRQRLSSQLAAWLLCAFQFWQWNDQARLSSFSRRPRGRASGGWENGTFLLLPKPLPFIFLFSTPSYFVCSGTCPSRLIFQSATHKGV